MQLKWLDLWEVVSNDIFIKESRAKLPYRHLFQFIKWEDKEPYNIKELLKGE